MDEATYTYDVDDGVAVWDLREFVRAEPEDLEEMLETLVSVSDESSLRANVVRLPDAGSIGGSMLDLIQQYNAYFQDLPVERVALVSTDVKNLAVKSRLEIDDVDVETYDDQAAAVEWARAG